MSGHTSIVWSLFVMRKNFRPLALTKGKPEMESKEEIRVVVTSAMTSIWGSGLSIGEAKWMEWHRTRRIFAFKAFSSITFGCVGHTQSFNDRKREKNCWPERISEKKDLSYIRKNDINETSFLPRSPFLF